MCVCVVCVVCCVCGVLCVWCVVCVVCCVCGVLCVWCVVCVVCVLCMIEGERGGSVLCKLYTIGALAGCSSLMSNGGIHVRMTWCSVLGFGLLVFRCGCVVCMLLLCVCVCMCVFTDCDVMVCHGQPVGVAGCYQHGMHN